MRPHTSYLIWATPRSGSYLLCEALTNTYLAGRPTEFFGRIHTHDFMGRWGVSSYAACLSRILEAGTTFNGVFGGKMIWLFFEDFIDRAHEIAGYEKLSVPQLLTTVFPDLHHIWIIRRDKVRQAISYWKAIQTDIWVNWEGWEPPTHMPVQQKMPQRRVPTKEPIFDFKAIERLRRGLEQSDVEMQHFFADCGVQPFQVVYEDFVDTYEETALRILEYLHIPVPDNLVFAARKMTKQANEQSEEWLQRYYHIKLSKDATQGE